MVSDMEVVRRNSDSNGANLERIFAELGIRHEVKPLDDGVSGSLSFDGEGYTITVNANEGPQRQRFTAAHELAHYLMHRSLLTNGGKLHRDSLFGMAAQHNSSYPFRPVHEVQANKLAADLLMPEDVLKSDYNRQIDNVQELAKRFKVSVAAMKIRLKSLSLRA